MKTNHDEQAILAEQVKQTYGLAPVPLAATVINALIVFSVMRDVMPLALWLAAVITVSLLRAALLLRFRRLDLQPTAARIWGNRFLAGLTLSGMVWGSLGLFSFSGVSEIGQVFVAFVLGGMAAGAAATFSQLKGGYLAFSIPALTPLALHFLLIHDIFHFAMGGMVAFFGVLLWRISEFHYRTHRTSLELRFENRGMIDRLQSAKEHAEELYRTLLVEVDARLKAEADLRAHQQHLERTVEERTTDLLSANEQLKAEIEERKETEKALRESEQRLALAQRAGRVGVFDWDPINDETVWSEPLEELFGLGRRSGSFKGSYEEWARHVQPDDLLALEEHLREWMREQREHIEFEYRFIRPDGRTRWMSVNAHVSYDDEGSAVRMVGTIVDVSDLKEAQDKLTAAKNAAEAASLAKSEFLANMSHEIRTPLAGAMGMINLVLEMKIGKEERQLLEMAKRSTDSLLRLISDLLDFSRLEAGIMQFEKKPYPVARLVSTAVEVVSITAREKGLQLSSRIDGTVPEYLDGDEGRLRQVLVNLVGNAVKFTKQGDVAITVERFQDPEADCRDFLLFSIRDTGIGIPTDQIEKIFGKFIQVDSSSTRRYGGAGIGLALSRQIIERMGGRIWAESRVGEGSIFHFTFPLE